MEVPREQIINTINQIIHFIHDHPPSPNRSNYEQYHQLVYDEFTGFANQFPSIFRIILEDPDHFPMDRMKQMLRQRDQIQNGSMTSESASIKVGQEYYNEFVKPRVNT